jgi:hypothetical protein
MNIRKAILPVAALSVTLLSSPVLAVSVQVQLYGLVTNSYTSLVGVNDVFNLSFTYETTTAGACPGAVDASSIYIYRCLEAVTSADASVGDVTLSTLATQPFPNPIGSRQSLLQAENTDTLFSTPRDQFQGSVNFSPASGINFPIVAFYLVDLTGAAMPNPPRLPTTWDSSSVASYQDRRFSLYDYTSGANVIASGVITLAPPTPVPVPDSYALMALGLGLLSWVARKKQRNE